MSASKQLLENIIDYAGTYPPAQLEPLYAFKNYREITAGPDQWIVGNLAWASSELATLADLISKMPGDPVGVAVIGRPSSDQDSWEAARAADAADLNVFIKSIGDDAIVETYEARVPELGNIEQYLKDLNGFKSADVFVELPTSESFDEALAIMAELEWPKAKLRTGGKDAASVPTAATLARFIHQCVSLELPFKLTAGLHNPLAYLSERTLNHGFLNALYAVGAILDDDATESEILPILESTDSNQWKCGKMVSYRGAGLSSDTIDEIRSLFLSFGSCSVEEPLDGLKELDK